MRNAWLGLGFMLIGCVGKAPPSVASDASVDADLTDASVEVTVQKVSGKVIDFFTGDALDTTAITTAGLLPAQVATSAADGTYSMDIAVGSKLFATTTRTNFRTTRSAAITVDDQPVTLNLFALASADVARQFTSVGKAQVSGTILAADLETDLGEPLTGIALTAISLVDAGNLPVVGVDGPYYFGAVGDLDLAITTSTAYGAVPHARMAYLNVPPGTYTLKVNYTNANLVAATHTTIVTIDAGGATLALSGGVVANSALTAIADPLFATDIYPRLQKASKGGLGCASCHTANGPASVLPYDNIDPAVVLAKIKATANVINTTTPATSTFLTFPLYEVAPPQNHPNATFLDVNDPAYKLFLLWITNGTKP